MLNTLNDVVVLKRQEFDDDGGYFSELVNLKSLQFSVVQLNLSSSKKGVIRGIHYQKEPYSQAKFVSVIKGRIFDVVIDLGPNSTTFGKWVSFELSEDNCQSLLIPRGFAHGFQSLEDNSLVLYAVDNIYNPESGIRYKDPTLAISWPISNPILSKKDLSWPTLDESIKAGALLTEGGKS
jgi:dTDP-4-dehydrorhamnose 3,5-epimerase